MPNTTVVFQSGNSVEFYDEDVEETAALLRRCTVADRMRWVMFEEDNGTTIVINPDNVDYLVHRDA